MIEKPLCWNSDCPTPSNPPNMLESVLNETMSLVEVIIIKRVQSVFWWLHRVDETLVLQRDAAHCFVIRLCWDVQNLG